MNLLYNISTDITWFLLKIIAAFNKKINLFVKGRMNTFSLLSKSILPNDDVIWFHCASLGEFEQGRPIIEKIKIKYPKYKIVLTFFSPSGYEVQKKYDKVDVVTYLPFDTRKNAQKFLEIVHPKIAVFVKYEFWPSILKELENRKIHTILVSGVFRPDQIFFKPYGGWMKESLKAFSHFFVQNDKSKKLLSKIGIDNSTVSGDTRFDRVFEITNQDNHMQFIEDFIQNKNVLIAGSTWPKDEELLVDYINIDASVDEKFIIAPHNISPQGIEKLKRSIQKETTLFTDKNRNNNAQVFIVDTIGILTKVYSYAKIVYIGGGFEKDGIHNILEPATFGLPLIIGPRFDKFQEAIDLVDFNACEVVKNSKELKLEMDKLYNDSNYRENKEKITKNYIMENVGATEIIVNYISKTIEDA